MIKKQMWILLFSTTLIFPFLSSIILFTCCKKKQKISKRELIKNKMSQLEYPQYPIIQNDNSTLVCTLSKSLNTAKSSGVSTAELESSTSKTALTQDNLSLNSEKMESIANKNSEKATITDGKSEITIIGKKTSLTLSN
uniref:Uncharacterized protein n=1 Tax=Meloidogyne enterolobii TaxID=390850 RepID=A0A6V7VY37_MELEN|nr:unnamed protein product [Meloidogyne enterolobii]